jgi:hypothetical protein
VPIDEDDVPTWAASYLAPGQLKVNRGLVWILLLYKRRGFDQSRVNVAQRLHIHTEGKDRKEANPGYKSLALDLGMSENTAMASVSDLEDEGWIVIRGPRRYPTFQLAWPQDDVIARSPAKPEVKLCGRPTTKGGRCTKRAGRGTPTPGEGPCKDHAGTPEPQPLQFADEGETDSEPQPLRFDPADDPPVEPQPLRFNPVDNPEIRTRSTATTADLNRNHCGSEPQPLRISTATIAAEYVRSTTGVRKGVRDRVLAVGELTVRTARPPAAAPPAQPESLTARGIVAAIPRYRAAEPWVRKRLAALIATALEAGFGRDAILRYAHMVIGEARYLEHQHLPELREALRRLGRDAALGDVPATPEPPLRDAPWTREDQARWERILDQFGVTPDSLGPADTA